MTFFSAEMVLIGAVCGGLGTLILMYLGAVRWIIEYRLENLKSSEFQEVVEFASNLEKKNNVTVKMKSHRHLIAFTLGTVLCALGMVLIFIGKHAL